MAHRRQLIAASLGLALPWAARAKAVSAGSQRLAAAWRDTSPTAGEPPDRVGILSIDWDAGEIRVQADLPAPGRGHGLLALADGGFVAVATRPGRWLLRCDADGRVQRRLRVDDEAPAHTFNGHVLASADGQWLLTTETDPRSGDGCVSVRDAATLARVAQFASGGLDPHHALLADDGALLVANGGIPRAADGRKIDLERMAPSLARIDAGSGQVLDQWRLRDARLSPRHLAWGRGPTGEAVLGIGLQAEHDAASQRRDAPVLALWDGQSLSTPSADAQAVGYAGDLAAGPDGGFVLSGQKSGCGLWWHPASPSRLTRIAELTEPCALATWPSEDGPGVLIGAARGVARWHPRQAPRMLAWPRPRQPDNHWVLLV